MFNYINMDDTIEKKPITPSNLSDSGKISDKILVDNKSLDNINNSKIIDKSENNNIFNTVIAPIKDTDKQLKLKPKKKKKKKKNRCCHKYCNKKLGIVDWNCKCGLKFCKFHRFPCGHNCTFDWHKNKKDILDKALMSAKCDFKKIDVL